MPSGAMMGKRAKHMAVGWQNNTMNKAKGEEKQGMKDECQTTTTHHHPPPTTTAPRTCTRGGHQQKPQGVSWFKTIHHSPGPPVTDKRKSVKYGKKPTVVDQQVFVIKLAKQRDVGPIVQDVKHDARKK